MHLNAFFPWQEQGVQSKTEEADKLTAVLKLQSQLDSAREQAAQREAELRDEVQQVRRDKKELEAKFAGLDLNKMEVCFRASAPVTPTAVTALQTGFSIAFMSCSTIWVCACATQ